MADLKNDELLAEFDKTTAVLNEIQEKGNFLPDCSTDEGYEASKRFVLDITTKARTRLTDAHKQAKKPFKDICDNLDARKKKVLNEILRIEAPHKDAYKAKDQEAKLAKEQFEKDIEAKVQRLFDYRVEATGRTSQQIQSILNEVENIDTLEGYYHLTTKATETWQGTLQFLSTALETAQQAEHDAAELAELRKLKAQMQQDEKPAEPLAEPEIIEEPTLVKKEVPQSNGPTAEDMRYSTIQMFKDFGVDATIAEMLVDHISAGDFQFLKADF